MVISRSARATLTHTRRSYWGDLTDWLAGWQIYFAFSIHTRDISIDAFRNFMFAFPLISLSSECAHLFFIRELVTYELYGQHSSRKTLLWVCVQFSITSRHGIQKAGGWYKWKEEKNADSNNRYNGSNTITTLTQIIIIIASETAKKQLYLLTTYFSATTNHESSYVQHFI